MLAYILILVFAAAMIYGAINDLMTMTIPNIVSIVLAGVFPVAALAAGLGWADFFAHVAAGGIVLAAGIALFAGGIIGGGDAKLLAAASLWVGLDQLMPFIMHVGIYGGILALVILMYRRFPAAIASGGQWMVRLHDKDGGIPYGVAIACGALMVFTKTGLYALVMA